jgi:sugar diacid utilization regulator
MYMAQLLDHIPADSVRKATIKKALAYAGIRLIYGAQTKFEDDCVYVGSLSGVSAEAYKTKRIGLITVDRDYDNEDFDCVTLADDVNILALYEELKNLWQYNDIAGVVATLSSMFTNKDIGSIINQTARILNNPVTLIDYRSNLLSAYCDQPIDDPDMQYLFEHGRMSPKHLKDAYETGLPKTILNSLTPNIIESGPNMTHKKLLGMIRVNRKGQAAIIVMEYNRKLSAADSNIVDAVCNTLSRLFEPRSRNDRQAGIKHVMYESRLIALIKQDPPPTDPAWVTGWLAHMRWDKYRNFHAIVVQADNYLYDNTETSEIINQLQRQIADCCILLHDYAIVIILNVKDNASFRQHIEELERVLSAYGLRAGVSERFTEIQALGEHCRQAEDAIGIGKLRNRQDVVNFFAEQMPYDLLLKAKTQGSLKRYDDYRLHILTEYDSRYGTDYHMTLHTFLRNACSRTQTAQHLHICRNTIDYRMNKIRELLDFNAHNGEDCLKLYLAFKAEELEKASLRADAAEKQYP